MPVELWQMGCRQAAWNGMGAKSTADRGNSVGRAPPRYRDHKGRTHHGHDRSWDEMNLQPWPEKNHRKAGDREPHGKGIHREEMIPDPNGLFKKLTGHVAIGPEAQKVRHLGDDDGHGNSCSKAAGHRPRDELDEVSHAGEPHQNQDDSGHHGGDDQADITVL